MISILGRNTALMGTVGIAIQLMAHSAFAELMHQVKINETFPKLTRQITVDSLGRELFAQSTAACVLYLTDGSDDPITQSIFIADQTWGRVVYGERFGNFVRSAGRGTLEFPIGIASDRWINPNWTYIYIADAGLRTIVQGKYTFSSGELTLDGTLTDLSDPEIGAWELAVRTQDGSVWAIDNSEKRIVKFDARTGPGIVYHYGNPGTGVGQFGIMSDIVWGRDPSSPYGSNLDYLHVLDDENHRVVRLHWEWVVDQWELVWDRTHDLPSNSWITALEVDGFGNMYLADYLTHMITKLSPDFELLGTFGGPGKGPGQFVNITSLSNPLGVRAGDLFVTENWSDTTGGDWYVIGVEATFVSH